MNGFNGSPAPAITGLTFVQDLGSGGFADVYLYQSISPARPVAVKVLRESGLSAKLAQRFAVEADTMAALEHPHIVRVYDFGTTDDGRPYIEMAYYPRESLAAAVKREPFSVADALRVGVQLASAVETAHRAGLLHRDIKPANVLTDRYNEPALTDFGIASRIHDDDDEEASLSVPWAPPEAMFSTSPVDERSDVYSLAATLWHLLVGRSPYELPGGDNRPSAMMIRTRDLPAPSTGRGDVPASFDRLLQAALSKDPRYRPASAADFARALQVVEEELHLRQTPFKVALEDSLDPRQLASEDDRTRRQTASRVVSPQWSTGPISGRTGPRTGTRPGPRFDSTGPGSAPPLGRSGPRFDSTGPGSAPLPGRSGPLRPGSPDLGRGPEPADATVTQRRAQPVDPTTGRPSGPSEPEAEPVPEAAVGSRRGLWVAAVALAVVLLAGGGAYLVWGGRAPEPVPQLTQPAPDPGWDMPPGQPEVKGYWYDGGTRVEFDWDYSGRQETDTYRVRTSESSQEQRTSRRQWVDLDPTADPYCVQVQVVRLDGNHQSPWSKEACAQ
ncbi:MAG: protein kinase [Propionibacteriaceae bacterium]|nr:protein kinase [Propionibacteriaceae bacterium]